MDVRTILRQSEGELLSEVAAEKAYQQLCRLVLHKVGDPRMNPVIAARVARALVGGRLSRQEIDQLLDSVEIKRRAGELSSPGAYFVASVKRIFQREEISWR